MVIFFLNLMSAWHENRSTPIKCEEKCTFLIQSMSNMWAGPQRFKLILPKVWAPPFQEAPAGARSHKSHQKDVSIISFPVPFDTWQTISLFSKGSAEIFEREQPGILWLLPAGPNSQDGHLCRVTAEHANKGQDWEGQENGRGRQRHPGCNAHAWHSFPSGFSSGFTDISDSNNLTKVYAGFKIGHSS